MKKLVFIISLLLFQLSYGQLLKAKVVDENNEPITSAEVYFDGTTVGVITNLEGEFRIEKPDNLTNPTLVIMSLGYESIYISDVQKFKEVYQLKRNAIKLDVVNIIDSPFSRDEMMKVFKKYFVGATKHAKYCEIINPADVHVYYKKNDKTLYAKSENPIFIQNNYLGYKIRFDLKVFKVEYSKFSLEEKDFNESFYAGYSFFEDTNPLRKKLRDKVYFSSLNYFLKALVEDKLDLTNFYVGHNGEVIDANDIFEIEPLENNLFEVSLKSTIQNTDNGKYLPSTVILVHKNDLSNIIFKTPGITIDQYGNNLDFNDIRLKGELSEYRIARMLPSNYEPN